MSHKTESNTRARLWVALALATLAGCASPPAPTADEDASPTGTLSGPPAEEVAVFGCNAASLRQSLLQRVNQARAAGAACGDAKQLATKALVWQPALAAVATRRATEMAQKGSFGAPDARGTEQRLRQEGYRAAVAHESAAGGDYTSESVTQTWLQHQQQCMVLTSPQYTDVGAGCANAPGSELGHYWTVVVARPGDTPAAKAGAAKPKAKPGKGEVKPKAATRGVKPVAARQSAAPAAKKSTAAAKKSKAAAGKSTARASSCTTAACKAGTTVK